MTTYLRGTKAYNQRMVEVAEEMRGVISPTAWPTGETSEGIRYDDVYAYIYNAMAESDPTSGGLLVPPSEARGVRQPQRA